MMSLPTDAEMQQMREEVATHGRVLTQGERVIAKYRKANIKYGRLFTTPEGAELLDNLQKMYYDNDPIARTPDSAGVIDQLTYANLGAREVVRYLMDLRDSAKKEK